MAISYSIHDLEKLTGIKAHTIRIWEQRYGLLRPGRTSGNFRKYDDHDLRKILNVNTLKKKGWKISNISRLAEEEMEEAIWNIETSGQAGNRDNEAHIKALIAATVEFDEAAFDMAFDRMMTSRPVTEAIQHVLGPFLERIGLMWSTNQIHPAQEHFASNCIRRKLMSAIDRMPPAENNKPVILFLPPWEDHEIALMHTWYLLKSVGQRVIYLGQRVPLKALLQAIDAVSPGALMTFFISEESGKAIRSFINGIKDRHPHLPLYAGIRSDLEARNFLTTVPGLTLLHDPQEVVSLVAGNNNTP